ncbi:hypothetical protein WH47_07958 [Habropoda laboriosa]|uniref:Uncharacterized protein n=1 Tax=Habropoda laboriosa TaxID=597456 RepID=A0A0L7RIJ4_9HYME|nr:hypothetical protein WH47_07958 [Habropoda laboriosa]
MQSATVRTRVRADSAAETVCPEGSVPVAFNLQTGISFFPPFLRGFLASLFFFLDEPQIFLPFCPLDPTDPR